MTDDELIVKKLTEELNEASYAYYNTDNTIMSDSEFDNKLEQLKMLEKSTGLIMSNSPTRKVGAPVLKILDEVKHETPMLSLDKCHSADEVSEFSKGKDLVASVKLDGISCRLIYQDGNLIMAESRGNGVIGSDITEAVKNFQNVPLHINKTGKYIIDGEALIKLDDFEEINTAGKFKNSRNLAAGTLSSLDLSVVKERRMRWYAWEVISGSDEGGFFERLAEAYRLGFDVVPNVILSKSKMSIDEAIDFLLGFADVNKLPQDGVVFKFEDIAYGKSLGNTEHHFRNGIAFKVANDAIETSLKYIDWTMGKTGILTPTAVFDPVELEGTTVERASLHNVSILKETIGTPWIGQRLGVFKANLIIPQVRWAEQDDNITTKKYLITPEICPICGGQTTIVKENDSEVLMCTNPECTGKLLGKLSHAVNRNALDIDGLSEATLQRFIDLGWLTSIKDIYHLDRYKDNMKVLSGFGAKSAKKLVDSIEESRHTTLERFLIALSIPMVGKKASNMISEACDDNVEFFFEIMDGKGARFFNHLPGVGNSIINSLQKYWDLYGDEYKELHKEFVFEEKKENILPAGASLAGKTFVVTGSVNHFTNRDELKKKIESLGGKVASGVTKKVNYLINNDVNSTSSKNKKAKELGIPIISEEQFLEMV